MLDCPDPPKPPPKLELNLFVSEESLTGAQRRSDLAMEFLDTMSNHESGVDDATDSAEAIAVFMATTAYLCIEFGIPELKLISDMRHLHKRCTLAKKRLGSRSTARDMFAELAVMGEEENILEHRQTTPSGKTKLKPKSKSSKKR